MVNASKHQVYARITLGLANWEILRKSIHIAGFILAFNVTHLKAHIVSSTIFFIAIIYSLSELARTRGKPVPVISAITQRASKTNGESEGFVTAPLFFSAGIALPLLMFPTAIAQVSITVLTIGDGFAYIFGKRLGNTPVFFNKRKKVEGSISGFVLAFAACNLFVDPIRSFVGATVGMVMECLPLPIDDNIVIPLSAGTACTVVSLWLGV